MLGSGSSVARGAEKRRARRVTAMRYWFLFIRGFLRLVILIYGALLYAEHAALSLYDNGYFIQSNCERPCEFGCLGFGQESRLAPYQFKITITLYYMPSAVLL